MVEFFSKLSIVLYDNGKVLDCGHEVSEFELQLRYYIHFRTNTLGKDMKTLYPRIYGLNCIPAVFYNEGFVIK